MAGNVSARAIWGVFTGIIILLLIMTLMVTGVMLSAENDVLKITATPLTATDVPIATKTR